MATPTSDVASRQSATSHVSDSKVDLDLLAIDTIRTLAIDAVEKADSGHAGAPMAMAPPLSTAHRISTIIASPLPLYPPSGISIPL